MHVVVALLLLGAALCGLLLYVRWRLYWTRVLDPFGGPKVSLPVVGTLLYALGPMSTLFERALKLLEHYGNNEYASFWLGERPVLHLMRPEDLECLLGSMNQNQKLEIVYKTVSGFFGR